MKNYVFATKILIFTLLTTMFFSCEDKETLEVQQKENSKNDFFRRVSNDELNNFKNDEILQLFSQSYHKFVLNVKNKHYQDMAIESVKGNDYMNQLYLKYGEDKVVLYMDELSLLDVSSPTDPFIIDVFGTHDGSSCTRNQNGTTYWGNCSFWQGVRAYFAILGNCGHIDLPTASQAEFESYANCNQSQICKHC